MRRKLLITFVALLFFISCQKTDSLLQNKILQESAIIERKCGSHEVLEAQMTADPSLKKRIHEIETFTRKTIASGRVARLVNGIIEIPVVVHVVYRTPNQNISDAQVQSQIDVLNEDFNRENEDTAKVPEHFASVNANVGVRFVLDRIIRKNTNKTIFFTNDDVKKDSNGGSTIVDPSQYLNIWSCNLGQGFLGYAQFPGGNPATDGVVILYSVFGRNDGSTNYYLLANYNKGRTATHEVGHWLNLRHIWGDAACGNDYVEDTPLHDAANYGSPATDQRSTCAGTPLEMWMNYMDYTYDANMYMFSAGQKNRMLAVLSEGGPRASFTR